MISPSTLLSMAAGLLLTAPIPGLAPVAFADTAPRSAAASPDIYQVAANDRGLRVVVATWQPGQRDQWHSHPTSVYYWLTDCDARIHAPSGKYQDLSIKAGMTGVQAPIESHSLENRSTTTCKVLMVEQD